jgi:hypothetical protein
MSLKHHDPLLQFLRPTPALVPSPSLLYLQNGTDSFDVPLHQIHSTVRLYGDHRALDPEKPSPLETNPEPTLQRDDARHDLLVQFTVQLVLFRLPQEHFAASQLVIVPV